MRRQGFVVALVSLVVPLLVAVPSAQAEHTFSFDIETVDDPAAGTREPDAVRAPDGRLVVAYLENEPRRLMVAEGVFGSWTVAPVDTTGDLQYPSVAVSGDRVGIAYFDADAGALRFATRSGSGPWSVQTVDSWGETGLYPSLAFDAAGLAHIAYYDATATALRFAVETVVGAWVLSTVDDTGTVGTFADLRLVGDVAHVAYYDTSGARLRLASERTGGWQLRVADGTSGSGWYASLAAFADGRLAVAHYNWDRDELRLSRETASGFSTQVVSTARDPGHNLRLAIGSDDRPAIFYKADGRGVTQTRAHIEHRAGVWATATLEAFGATAMFHDRVGIVAGGSGFWDVFYRRESDQALRHARIYLLEADFTWDPPVGLAGQPFAFEERAWSAIGPIVSYEWDFAGYGTGSGRTPQFAFPEAGVYPVTLVVRTAEGWSASATHDVPVGLAPPVAIIDGPIAVTMDVPFDLDGSRSYDVDGVIVSYRWDFPDGTVLFGVTARHELPLGAHRIRLTVTDDDGLVGVDEHVVVSTGDVRLTVEMTKRSYSPLQPQDGRVRTEALQGGPVPGVSVHVLVRQRPAHIFQELLGYPDEYRYQLVTDALGRAEFQVPLGLAPYLHPAVPELLSVPSTPLDTVHYRVLATAQWPWVGWDETHYRILLLDPFPVLPAGPGGT